MDRDTQVQRFFPCRICVFKYPFSEIGNQSKILRCWWKIYTIRIGFLDIAGTVAYVTAMKRFKKGGEDMCVPSPFADAVAAWPMENQYDTKGKYRLSVQGDAHLGVELDGSERRASIDRAGDGIVAELRGGYIVAGNEGSRPFELKGREMTLCVRLKDGDGLWDSPLLSRKDPADSLGGIIYAFDAAEKPYPQNDLGGVPKSPAPGSVLEYRWRTRPPEALLERRKSEGELDSSYPVLNDLVEGVMPLRAPVDMFGRTGWHDIIVRFDGPRLELFVDGVLVDEDWPYGELHDFSGPMLLGAGFVDGRLKTGFRGSIDHVAFWQRALTDEEIELISGGREHVAIRQLEILGPEADSMQYWKPRGWNTYAGDAMLLFDNERLHLFWLFDRRHHASKWGLGAHQYAHAATDNLSHWEHLPLAVPLTHQWEAAIGTGDFVFNEGRIIGVYTDCGGRCQFADKPHQGNGIFLVESDDGVHFQKGSLPILPGGDCTIFQDESTGVFHILTPGNDAQGRGGLLDYASHDLRSWVPQQDLFLDAAGCCPHYFQWNSWFYLTVGGLFWKSTSPLGPWDALRPNRIDQPNYYFPKTAAFKNGRRIAAAWVSDDRWGNELVFWELIQSPSGELGTKFPAEMIPEAGDPIEPADGGEEFVVCEDAGRVNLRVKKDRARLPRDFRLSFRVVPDDFFFTLGICLRGSEDGASGVTLVIDSERNSVAFGEQHDGHGTEGAAAIHDVDGLERPFGVDVVAKGPVIDACLDGRRTIVTRNPSARGDGIAFFASTGSVNVEAICLRPLITPPGASRKGAAPSNLLRS